jgi:hypothetical protein
MMPRNSITKEDLKVKILKLINEIHQEPYSEEVKHVAKKYLNEVLFTIEQYSR